MKTSRNKRKFVLIRARPSLACYICSICQKREMDISCMMANEHDTNFYRDILKVFVEMLVDIIGYELYPTNETTVV